MSFANDSPEIGDQRVVKKRVKHDYHVLDFTYTLLHSNETRLCRIRDISRQECTSFFLCNWDVLGLVGNRSTLPSQEPHLNEENSVNVVLGKGIVV